MLMVSKVKIEEECDHNNQFSEAFQSLIFHGFKVERVVITVFPYNCRPNTVTFQTYATWNAKEIEAVRDDSWMFNLNLCSEGATGNCSNLLMKVFRLPFVNGNNHNETHVYALKLVHSREHGAVWNMVRAGVYIPIYPARGSDHDSYSPEFVTALMGAYKVVFYAPQLVTPFDKKRTYASFKVSNCANAMTNQSTH